MKKGRGTPKVTASNSSAVRKQDIEPKSDTADTQEEPTLPSFPATNSNPPPIRLPTSKHKWHKPIEWWKTRLEVVGIIFAIGYAVVTWLQWRDLRHNFAADERAWLKISPETVFPPTTDPLVGISDTMLQVDNIGKSASLRTNVQARFEIAGHDQQPTLSFKEEHHQFEELGLLFPNEQRRFETYMYDANNVVHRFSKADVDALARGETYLAIYAEVVYIDQFGGKHWTRMCSWKAFHPGKFRAESCVAWNNVGEGAPPSS